MAWDAIKTAMFIFYATLIVTETSVQLKLQKTEISMYLAYYEDINYIARSELKVVNCVSFTSQGSMQI